MQSSSHCFCIGRGEVEEEKVGRLCALLEVISGRRRKDFKTHEYVLQGPERNPNMLWVEEHLLKEAQQPPTASSSREASYKLCCSGRMRSAVQVKGNVGQMRSLIEVDLTCETKQKLFSFLEDLNFSIMHDFVKEGYVFHLLERGTESLLLDQSENKFQLYAKVVQLKTCAGMEEEEEEVVFPGKWLVELVAKASGAEYTQAILNFEEAAKKISSIVQVQATK